LQIPDRTLRSVRDDTVGVGACVIRRPGCGTVEVEGSCGRLGDLHFNKNTRRPGARTGVLTGRGLALSTSCPVVAVWGFRAAE
jgi:hypothetical protein